MHKAEACDSYPRLCDVTGQLSELKIDTFTCRPFPGYLDVIVRKNMNEFHSVEDTERVLALQ